MPRVEVVEQVPVSLDAVWSAVNDVESFPRLMDHVHAVEVLDSGAEFRRSAWEIDLKGCRMRWVEHEEILADVHRIEYRQVEGDLKTFEGHWQLEAVDAATTRVTLTVHFEIGLPMLSDMLDPVAERAIRNNSTEMLHAVSAAAGARALERR